MLLKEASSSSPLGIVLGALIAALGYVGKQLWDAVLDRQRSYRTRKSRIVELQSLLRATGVSYEIQNLHAQRLFEMLQARLPELDTSGGYEQTFTTTYPTMTPQERELHDLIRSITLHALRPGNAALISWLKQDDYFKAQGRRKLDSWRLLAQKLADLETHAILWQAKFEMWIPDRPEHALVYMVDEQQHGKGFPVGVDELVDQVYSLM